MKSCLSPLLVIWIKGRQSPGGIICTRFTPSDFYILRVWFEHHTFVIRPCWTLNCVYKALDWCLLPRSNKLQPWVASLRMIFNSVLKHFTYGETHFLVNCWKGFNDGQDWVCDLPFQYNGSVQNSYAHIQELSWVRSDTKTSEEVSDVLRVSASVNWCSHAHSRLMSLRLALLQWLPEVSEPSLTIWDSVYIPNRAFINNKNV